MSGKQLLLAAALGGMLVGMLVWMQPAAAKETKEDKKEWKYYGDPKDEGSVPGRAYLVKDVNKAWKAAGKPKLDLQANPNPFALLTGNITLILYVDGKRASVWSPIKVKPGTHTVVVMLAGQTMRSKDCFEFQIKCEAGREYLIQPVTEKKLFRKGTWEAYVQWRPIPPGYPKERQAKNRSGPG